jgi:hypothetical protein
MWWSRSELRIPQDIPVVDPFTTEVAQQMEYVRNCAYELQEACKTLVDMGVFTSVSGRTDDIKVKFTYES